MLPMCQADHTYAMYLRHDNLDEHAIVPIEHCITGLVGCTKVTNRAYSHRFTSSLRYRLPMYPATGSGREC